nr:putative reverse transcriptase domain-containing protein [Tanacetum cinerariifolium]
MAYKLELPKELSNVQNTFHVFNLKKCLSDESLIIPMKELKLDEKLNFVEEPVEIMDREIKQLRQSRIPIIKVRWNSKRGPEYTWEREDEIRAKYPHLNGGVTVYWVTTNTAYPDGGYLKTPIRRIGYIYTLIDPQFADGVLDLNAVGTLQFQLGGIDADSSRVIASKADLRDYWIEISSSGDFLTRVPSYTAIREPLKRLCHRLIAVTITGRGWAPKKVTTTDLYYLMSMDEGMDVDVKGGHQIDAEVAQGGVAGEKDYATEDARLKKEAHELYQSIEGLCGLADRLIIDQSRQRTDGAGTSATPHTNDQPDP